MHTDIKSERYLTCGILGVQGISILLQSFPWMSNNSTQGKIMENIEIYCDKDFNNFFNYWQNALALGLKYCIEQGN